MLLTSAVRRFKPGLYVVFEITLNIIKYQGSGLEISLF